MLKQGKKGDPVHQQVYFVLLFPVQIVRVIVTGKYLQVPHSCVGWYFMQPSKVVVYKLKQKLNVSFVMNRCYSSSMG